MSSEACVGGSDLYTLGLSIIALIGITPPTRFIIYKTTTVDWSKVDLEKAAHIKCMLLDESGG